MLHPFHRVLKSNTRLHVLLLRLSTGHGPNCCRFGLDPAAAYLLNSRFLLLHLMLCGVTIDQPWPWHQIPFFMHIPSTLKLIITLSRSKYWLINWCFILLHHMLRWLIFLRKARLSVSRFVFLKSKLVLIFLRKARWICRTKLVFVFSEIKNL